MLSYAQYGGGTGTAANPYLINTVEHLANLASNVNAGNPYNTAHFILMNDLDLAGWAKTPGDDTGWEPIGSLSKPFGGYFHGNNKVIRNLTIKRISAEDTYQGLFGYYTGRGIDDLTLENLDIDISGFADVYVGGLVGYSNNNLRTHKRHQTVNFI
jgi:hypothetical protein